MAVVRKKDGVPNYDEIREKVEQQEMMNGAYIDPSNIAKYITILDTGHGKIPSNNSTRYTTVSGFGVSFSDWYKYGQVLSPWSKLYEDEND